MAAVAGAVVAMVAGAEVDAAVTADAVSGTKRPTYGSVPTRPPRVGDPRPAEDLLCGMDRCMIVSRAVHPVCNKGCSTAPPMSTSTVGRPSAFDVRV